MNKFRTQILMTTAIVLASTIFLAIVFYRVTSKSIFRPDTIMSLVLMAASSWLASSNLEHSEKYKHFDTRLKRIMNTSFQVTMIISTLVVAVFLVTSVTCQFIDCIK